MYKIWNLQNFFTDCFEIRELHCIQICEWFYVSIMNPVLTSPNSNTSQLGVAYNFFRKPSCDISLESPLTIFFYYIAPLLLPPGSTCLYKYKMQYSFVQNIKSQKVFLRLLWIYVRTCFYTSIMNLASPSSEFTQTGALFKILFHNNYSVYHLKVIYLILFTNKSNLYMKNYNIDINKLFRYPYIGTHITSHNSSFWIWLTKT